MWLKSSLTYIARHGKITLLHRQHLEQLKTEKVKFKLFIFNLINADMMELVDV